jgi:ribosomal-protein-alanine N-acetyltransferase
MGDALPLGVIWFRVTLDEAELIDIRVALDARGKGIGRILLNAGLAALDDENIIECHLEVRESNAIARHLYLQMGFQETGRRRNYYPSPAVPNGREDAMLMSRRRQKGIAPS